MPTNQAFEEQFRERFINLEEAPPDFAWNKIRQEISPASVSAKAKAKPPKFTWLIPGAVISVISIALLFLVKYNKAMEKEQVSTAKEYALQAEAEELADSKEPVKEITPVVIETVERPAEKSAEKPAFKAYQAQAPKSTAAAQEFVKKDYLKKDDKTEASEILKVATVKKKLNATKVVYVVTVDPKSASVEKISTSVPDSAATNTAN